jgi:WD40 repeat protein/serine/threonine protein kinase
MTQPFERELAVFSAARRLPAADRAAYLDQTCAGDQKLRQRVEELLRASEDAGSFLADVAAGAQRPAGAAAAVPTLVLNVAAPGEKAGDRIGHYKLLQKIGEGGCGVVYMAEQDEPVRRRVALKVIKLGMDTRSVIARFEAERQALALMDHPNIARVLDAGATDTGRPYFVMELVRGLKITDYCDEKKLPPTQRLVLFIQVCQAMQHAHQKGIIHRDIKPSNILVTVNDGVAVPKVIDFGIAKATSGQQLTDKTLFTAFEQFIGTPAYMSPEQAVLTSLDIDTRSDIYALGVLLYELLTGKTPFDAQELLANGVDAMRRTIREQEPPRPSSRLSTLPGQELSTAAQCRGLDAPRLVSELRGDLDWIVMKCLEKDRARRYETTNGLALDIQRHLNNEPVEARPPSSLYRFQKLAQRNKLALGTAAGIAGAIVFGVAVSVWQAVRATRAEHEQSVLWAAAEKARQTEAGLRQTAQMEAARAEAASRELKLSLSASDFSQGVRFIAEGNGSEALAFLARSLAANPTNYAALTRLTTLLAYNTWMVPTLVFGNGEQATSVQFSPDGKQIITASGDTARVWDAQTGLPLTEPLQHSNRVHSAQFSPDGKRIVTASAMTVHLWDAKNGSPLAESMEHTNRVFSAQFSPDGNLLLTTSENNIVRVWDAQTGHLSPGIIVHDDVVRSAKFSPDGKRIVTASFNNTARVWDALTGRAITEPLRHSDWVNSVEFSPDGKRILTASRDRTARLWDAQNGQPLGEPLTHADSVSSAQFSPDGKRIVTASQDTTARVWDAETARPLTEALKHGGGVLSAQFSLDGRQILTTSFDHRARLWNAATGQPLCQPMEHGEAVYTAWFSPDGKRIATSSHDNIARVWDAQTGPARPVLMLHSNPVYSAHFSPDGKRIVTDGTHVWDALTGQSLARLLTHEQAGFAAEFSPDGKKIVTLSHDTRVWDAQTGKLLTGPLAQGAMINSARFSPDGKRILTVTVPKDKAARLWDAQTGEPLGEPMLHTSEVRSAEFSPDGKRILTASADNTVRVWDAETRKPLIGPLQHGGTVMSAHFSPDGNKIVTTSTDNTACVWDARNGQRLAEPMKHGSALLSGEFSPDGKRIVTASYDNTARVWDAQTGRRLAEPMKHTDSLVSAQFSPDGRQILTASHDGTARLWDAQTGQPLSEPMKQGRALLSAQFSPDGKRIVTGSFDWTAGVWDIGPPPGKYPDWLLPLSEALSGQVLNQQGILEETRLNRLETLNQIRQKLIQEKDDDDWVVWGRWLLADRNTRTISPFSQVTVPEQLENRNKESARGTR